MCSSPVCTAGDAGRLQEMMYIWNGYTVIGKSRDLTEGMLDTLNEAQRRLEENPSKI